LNRVRIYLDTSVISYLQTEDTPEKNQDTLDFWQLQYGVLNPKSRDDCRHIAIATLSNCKYIVSWNFKHFVNIKTINKVQAVNKILEYQEINILPPSMMIEGDE